MSSSNRREFLSLVGRGMLVAGIGTHTAHELGLIQALPNAWSNESGRLSFGRLEPLAALLSETPSEKLLSTVVPLLKNGTTLKDLVAACAVANARACGGEDYVGFHTFMALVPALQMSRELPTERAALPVLKVLHRNARCLEERGLSTTDTLSPMAIAATPQDMDIREAVRRRELGVAEQLLMNSPTIGDAWNALLPAVHDGLDVHRIVLAQRSLDMQNLVGTEYATTLLRQSVHYCWKHEEYTVKRFADLRQTLPKLFDQHGLASRKPGTREGDAAWLDTTFRALTRCSPADAAGLVATAISDGYSPNSICNAICLAANELVLRDNGRPEKWAQPNKPVGSVHGDSIGVHASDAANAWRYIASSCSDRNSHASLMLSAWHVAMDYHESQLAIREWEPRPTAEVLKSITTTEPAKLLIQLDGAIREKNQELVCGLVRRYCDLGHKHRNVLDLLLDFAISEDGALHAEKYYRTTTDELGRAMPQFQTRQLIALARVTASEYGFAAPGYEEACKLLNVV